MRMRQVEPRLPLVALTNRDFLQTGQPGASPWLGGLDIDDFGGDPIAAVDVLRRRRLLAGARLPAERQGHRPRLPAVRHRRRWSTTRTRNGIKVDPVDGRRQADDGQAHRRRVDGIITDYPDRLRTVLADRGFCCRPAYSSPFDIQAPPGRPGGPAGEHPAGVPVRAGQPGVSTLELDTGVTEDGHLVVAPRPDDQRRHCRDTAPARPARHRSIPT